MSPSIPLQGDVPNRFGLVKTWHMITCVCSVARHLFMFRKMRDLSLMLRLGNVSSLVTIMVSLGISYDLIEKKFVRSRDVVFFEDQTIEDIDKTKKMNP